MILFFIPAILSLTATGHEWDTSPRKAVQFSGLILTGDSLVPVPFATIWVKNTRRGTISDFDGFFSIAVRESDTLRFTSVGFEEVIYVVPDTLTSSRYSTIQLMTSDTIHLAETIIFPWPTREQFRYAFLHTHIPADDYDRARENLARAEMRERLQHISMDGRGNFRHMIDQHAQRLYHAGQMPPMRIFSPIAWAEFFRAWREGKFKRTD